MESPHVRQERANYSLQEFLYKQALDMAVALEPHSRMLKLTPANHHKIKHVDVRDSPSSSLQV